MHLYFFFSAEQKMAKTITQKVPQRKTQKEEEEEEDAFPGSLCLPGNKQSWNYFIYGSWNPTVLLSGWLNKSVYLRSMLIYRFPALTESNQWGTGSLFS